MENRMYAKPQFKCGICGEIYDELKDRNQCEAKCIKNQEIEAKKAAEAKKKEEQPIRKAKVDEAYKTYIKLRDDYVKDYCVYEYADDKFITNTLVNKWPSLGDVFDFLSM